MIKVFRPDGTKLIFDEEGYVLYQSRRWWVILKPSTAYLGCKNNGRFHRILIGAPKGSDVDHINRNGLDNRRSNLRVCTRSQNNANRLRPTPQLYRGVATSKKRYKASITFNGKNIYLGLFKTPEEAAEAYDEAAFSFFGDFATLNFPGKVRRKQHPDDQVQ